MKNYTNQTERLKAKLTKFDFGIDDRGFPTLFGYFDYNNFTQSIPFNCIDIEFMVSLLKVFNVEKLSELEGKECWITRERDVIIMIPKLIESYKGDGIPFNIQEWINKKNANKNLAF